MKKTVIILLAIFLLFQYPASGKEGKKKKVHSIQELSVGMNMSQVLKILGKPKEEGRNYWEYEGEGYVCFDSNNVVYVIRESSEASSQTETTEKLSFCGKCGKKRKTDEVFCGKCGFSYVAEKSAPETLPSNKEPPRVNPVFEYRTEFYYDWDLAREESLDQRLNDLGRMGWEVISQRRAIQPRPLSEVIGEWGVEVSLKKKN